jgi:beta-lactamase class A
MGNPSFRRRAFLVAAGGMFLCSAGDISARERANAVSALGELEAQLGGRVGVAALDTRDGASLAYRGDERFAMCSSYKWMLAAAILARVDAGEFMLSQRVPYSARDLIEVSPVTKARVDEGSLEVRELCAAAIEVSDNTAANLLLALLGGPQSLTRYLRGLGDQVTRLDRNETALNSNVPGDERDTTMPGAMVETMRKILLGNALSSEGRERLVSWMKNCRTGLERLRAGLPMDWFEGDKTGAGLNGAAVDNAIIWPPQRQPILVAAYLSGSKASARELNAAHARIGGIVASVFG